MISRYEDGYIALIQDVKQAQSRKTRNGQTRSLFAGMFYVQELLEGQFPLLQGRKIYWKGPVGELATFLQGDIHNVQQFKDNGCNYWDAWGDENGELFIDYGNAWLEPVNQVKQVVESLKQDPFGRRHLISGWRPEHIAHLSLPCCHYAYQWYVEEWEGEKYLHMLWVQRSVDVMLGLPADVILAALWNLLMAQTVGYKPGLLSFQLGDIHIYESHMQGVEQYLEQVEAQAEDFNPVKYQLNPEATVFNFKPDMFSIAEYNHADPIQFPLEV